ncbi:aspartate/glutamate racemase family protein [Kiloniella antarctica]|uniref:Aspartate/glutamate racemase family protein n=1 Tax=Kiloniella antarctica TaxID=1550907 RepID=A0ABW5BHB4_9PROT
MHLPGSHPTYGQDIGILVLDTSFQRIPGDIGNAHSFNYPVKYKVVKSATTDQIVTKGSKARALLPLFIKAAQELEREGVRAIVTSCGFLAVIQEELAAAVSIPVATSSLLLIPMVSNIIGPSKSIGIITADAGSLSQEHLNGAGIDDKIPLHIKGMETSKAFSESILKPPTLPTRPLDPIAIEKDLRALSKELQHAHPDIGAIVLECTNLQPYAKALRTSLNIPVFGIIDLVNLIQSGLSTKETS